MNLFLMGQVDTSGPIVAAPSSEVGNASEVGSESVLWTILSSPLNLAMLALLMFYLVLFLPQQRAIKAQQRTKQELLSKLKKNDRVITSSGIYGVVVGTSQEAGTVTLRIDESTNARMTISREMIQTVIQENTKS